MATSGSTSKCVSKSGYTNDYLVLDWKRNSYDASAATNNITVNLKIYTTHAYPAYNLVGNTTKLLVGGSEKVSDTNSSIDFRNTSESNPKTIATWTGNVQAASDGTCSVALRGEINYADDSSSHMKGGVSFIELTANITQIPRESEPTATNCNFGGTTTIKTNRASSSFTHTLVVSIGSHSETISNVGASHTFQVPVAWADAVPTSKTATLNVRCTTYSGNTQIGSAKTTTATVSVPASWVPTISLTSSITRPDSSGNAILSVSAVTLTASATTPTGTTISYLWKRGSTSIGTSATCTPTFPSAGTYDITITVTDGRGNSVSAARSITVVSGISSFECPTIVNFGETHRVTVTRKNSTIKHTITRQINLIYKDVQENVGSGTSLEIINDYTIPTNWAASVPSADSATMTVTVESFYGGTSLGSVKKTITVAVPSSSVPSIGSLSVEPVDAWHDQLLKSISKANITVNNGTPSAGAAISTYKFSGNALNKTVSAPTNSATTGAFSASGSQAYTVTLTDSRGRTATATTNITVTNYKKPTVIVTAHRCDSLYNEDDIGDFCQATVKGTYRSNLSGNTATVTFKYRIYGSTGSYTELSPYSSSISDGTINNVYRFPANGDNAYELVATVTDTVLSDKSIAAVTASMKLSTAMILTDYYKDRLMSIGKPATADLLTRLGNPGTAFYAGMENHYMDGNTYVPASGSDGMTNGWVKVSGVEAITVAWLNANLT